MSKLKAIVAVGAVALGLVWGSEALAGGIHNKHPYHAGYHFIAPVTAYTGVRFRAPIHFGAPMYYFPQSYLPRGMSYYPPPTYPYYAPRGRAGHYYMSATAYGYAYPW